MPRDIAEPLVQHVLGGQTCPSGGSGSPSPGGSAVSLCEQSRNRVGTSARVGLSKRANSLHLSWFCSVMFQPFLLHVMIHLPDVHQDPLVPREPPALPVPPGSGRSAAPKGRETRWGQALCPGQLSRSGAETRFISTMATQFRETALCTLQGSGTCWGLQSCTARCLCRLSLGVRSPASKHPLSPAAPGPSRALPGLWGDKRSGTTSAEPAGLLGHGPCPPRQQEPCPAGASEQHEPRQESILLPFLVFSP